MLRRGTRGEARPACEAREGAHGGADERSRSEDPTAATGAAVTVQNSEVTTISGSEFQEAIKARQAPAE